MTWPEPPSPFPGSDCNEDSFTCRIGNDLLLGTRGNGKAGYPVASTTADADDFGKEC